MGLPRHRTRSGSRRDVARLADQPIHSGASGSRGRDLVPRDLGRTLSPARTGAVSGRCRAGAGGIQSGGSPANRSSSVRRISTAIATASLSTAFRTISGALSPVSPVELRQRDYPQPQGLPEVPLPLPAGRPGADWRCSSTRTPCRGRRRPATADPLGFVSAGQDYQDKLAETQARTGLAEAIVCGRGRVEGLPLRARRLRLRLPGREHGLRRWREADPRGRALRRRRLPLVTGRPPAARACTRASSR